LPAWCPRLPRRHPCGGPAAPVQPRAEAAEWAAERASLVLAGRQGVELKVLVVWQEAP
jgi:hypothetical protein